MKKLLLILLFVVSVLVPLDSLAARGSSQLVSPAVGMFTESGSSTPSMEKVRQAIGAAATARGWQVTAEQPGKVTLRNNIRGKHEVVVDVTYDTKNVSVTYVSSQNLDYHQDGNQAYIHPKYNEWVELLIKGIRSHVAN